MSLAIDHAYWCLETSHKEEISPLFGTYRHPAVVPRRTAPICISVGPSTSLRLPSHLWSSTLNKHDLMFVTAGVVECLLAKYDEIARPRWILTTGSTLIGFLVEVLQKNTSPPRALPHANSSQELSISLPSYSESGTTAGPSNAILPPYNEIRAAATSTTADKHPCSSRPGRKKALCIDMTHLLRVEVSLRKFYRGDVRNFIKLLRKSYGFEIDDIEFLLFPRRRLMIESMKKLVEDAQPGDSFVFLYVGKGGQVKDLDGDEEDGFDEYILPSDWLEEGIILDDEMFEILAKDLPEGCRLSAIFDCDSSGSALDLPYTYSTNGDVVDMDDRILPCFTQQQRDDAAALRQRRRDMRRSKADVISISSCGDGQSSYDKLTLREYIVHPEYEYTRLFLSVVVKILSRSPNIACRELLSELRSEMSSLKWFGSTPQLSSSKRIDLNCKFEM